ncbi:MAG: hypothetical protein L0Y44_16495, partial [Phycisphaerales bacterium]|nr:hypothetical protein [Phycisphaerales bacterium]
MKRRLLRLGLPILAGAIINVAVAWGCAASIVLQSSDRVAMGVSSQDPPSWLIAELRRSGRRRFDLRSLGTSNMHEMFRRPFGVVDTAMIDFLPHEARSVPSDCFQNCSIIRDEAGWPMLSVSCEHVHLRDQETTRLGIRLNDAPPTATDTMPERFLPYKPIWPGFAINTIFDAAILWFLFAAPARLRRWRRIKRGLCPACAYP